MSVSRQITIPGAAVAWITSGDTGMSSEAIWAHMVGGSVRGHWNHPHDPEDLGRCLRLLEAVPEWKPRIVEMARHGTGWAVLSARWDEIAASMADEVGIDWSKGRCAPKTYALMRLILDEVGA